MWWTLLHLQKPNAQHIASRIGQLTISWPSQPFQVQITDRMCQLDHHLGEVWHCPCSEHAQQIFTSSMARTFWCNQTSVWTPQEIQQRTHHHWSQVPTPSAIWHCKAWTMARILSWCWRRHPTQEHAPNAIGKKDENHCLQWCWPPTWSKDSAFHHWYFGLRRLYSGRVVE